MLLLPTLMLGCITDRAALRERRLAKMRRALSRAIDQGRLKRGMPKVELLKLIVEVRQQYRA